MALTTGCNGTHNRIWWHSQQTVTAQYYQESIFCWCVLQTNKWSTWHSGVYRFAINPRQSIFRPPLHSFRHHSCTTKCSRNTIAGAQLRDWNSIVQLNIMLQIREAPASNPEHMSSISNRLCCRLSFPGMKLLPILIVLEFVFRNCVYVYGYITFTFDRVSLNKLKT
jgi:hypothetical protein